MKKILHLILIVSSFSTSAQQVFKPGFIVKSNKDTLFGEIKINKRPKAEHTIQFRNTAEQKIETFSAGDLLSFQIKGEQSYFSFTVNKTMNETENGTLTVGPEVIVERGTFFMQLLIQDKGLALFEMEDFLKTRYYVRENNNEPEELLNKVYLHAETKEIVRQKIYKNSIKLIAEKYNPAIIEKMDFTNIKYSSESLTKAFAMILSSDKKEAVKKIATIKYKIILQTGIQYNTERNFINTYNGNFRITSGNFLPLITIGAEALFHGRPQRVVPRFEAGWFRFDKSGTIEIIGTPVNYTSGINVYFFSASALYNVINTHQWRLFGGTGLNFFFTKEKIKSVSTPDRFFGDRSGSIDATLDIRAGIVFKNKVEIQSVFPVVNLYDTNNFAVQQLHFRMVIGYNIYLVSQVIL